MGAKGLMQKGVPPTLPKWILYIKIAILVLSLIILALAAYAVSLFSGWYTYGYAGAPGFLIFVVCESEACLEKQELTLVNRPSRLSSFLVLSSLLKFVSILHLVFVNGKTCDSHGHVPPWHGLDMTS